MMEMAQVLVPKYECLRCGHDWIGRIATKPLRCPQCKTPYWDRPRQARENAPESPEEARAS